MEGKVGNDPAGHIESAKHQYGSALLALLSGSARRNERGIRDLQAHHRVHDDTDVQIRRYQVDNPHDRLVRPLHLHDGHRIGRVPVGKLLVQHEQSHLWYDVDALLGKRSCTITMDRIVAHDIPVD